MKSGSSNEKSKKHSNINNKEPPNQVEETWVLPSFTNDESSIILPSIMLTNIGEDEKAKVRDCLLNQFDCLVVENYRYKQRIQELEEEISLNFSSKYPLFVTALVIGIIGFIIGIIVTSVGICFFSLKNNSKKIIVHKRFRL